MARRQARPVAAQQYLLEPDRASCAHCGQPAHIAYHSRRTVATLDGPYRLVLAVRRCQEPACPLYHQAYRPEEEGGWALPHGEFGLDVIALVGALRFREHRSVPEIHRALVARGVSIAERSVTERLHRYEELVALRLAGATRLRGRLAKQEQVILALDGLQPDVGHEVLWVLRDCLSGEVLLARSLLGATEADLVPLLREVADALPVPIRGVISDGQQSIRNAGRPPPAVPVPLPARGGQADRRGRSARRGAPEEGDPRRAADRACPRGARGRRGDRRAWLLPGGAQRADRRRAPAALRLGAPAARAARRHPGLDRAGGGKRGLPKELGHLQRLLDRGLATTADQWPTLRTAYGWVYRAAHLLANHDGQPGAVVRAAYQTLLATMTAQQATLGALAPAVGHFRKVTASYESGLFHCYDVPDLPPSNNALEQYFGSARYHERRATGRKGAAPGLVVRGAVRVVAAMATRGESFRSADLTRWRLLRRQLTARQEARHAQRRFRKDPEGYLTALERRLSA